MAIVYDDDIRIRKGMRCFFFGMVKKLDFDRNVGKCEHVIYFIDFLLNTL